MSTPRRLDIARQLIDDFAERTGLSGTGGSLRQRYLWTDAFAVQTCFALARALGDSRYRTLALELIEAVHEVLGKFRPDDARTGWISGFSEAEGRAHPTIGGLRIGKTLPERRTDEPFDEQLEWERDGQYFHYLARWVQALLQAARETGDRRYAVWAAELLHAAEKFIDKKSRRFAMAWKLSTDLSRPLVKNMGMHDPLEFLVCAVSVAQALPERAGELELLIHTLDRYCTGHDWATSDALGIGGLLLDAARSAQLAVAGAEVPDSMAAGQLLQSGLKGLEMYAYLHRPTLPAEYRLAFRECGLSLGLRVIKGVSEKYPAVVDTHGLDRFLLMADEIETFWIDPQSQEAATWIEHRDINAVTLAASLIASAHPLALGGPAA